MNLLPLISRLNLYKLKRAFGVPIDLYILKSSQTDVRTGQTVVQTRKVHIKRAIVLPDTQSRQRLMRKMAAGTEASRDFTAAGSYDRSQRKVIIDARDTPGVKELSTTDWIVWNKLRWQIVDIGCPDTDQSWELTVRAQVGEVPQQTFDVRVQDGVSLGDAAGVE